MSKILDVAIIGTGNIAGGFDENSNNKEATYSHAGAFSKIASFNLKSVFDIDYQKAKKFSLHWNIENIMTSEDDIIESYHDIISICTPDKFHFNTLKNLIINKSCKTIFVEKPVSLNLNEIEEIEFLSKKNKINVMVNFQRHFDSTYEKIKVNKNILSVNAYYIKGLKHIGVTMIDTILMLFGIPSSLYTFNKINNNLIKDDTYEFVFYYENFTLVVQTIDRPNEYNYHIFDINIFTEKGKYVITDNSNLLIKESLVDYDYSDVKVISSNKQEKSNTNYSKSMLKSVDYLYDITTNNKEHNINLVTTSYNIHLIIDCIIESFEKERKIYLKDLNWKK